MENIKFIQVKFYDYKIFLIKLDAILNINIIPSQKIISILKQNQIWLWLILLIYYVPLDF